LSEAAGVGSSVVDERERRIGQNEALFREVNERIERLSQTLQATDSITILCECGDASCTEQIEVSLHKYERVRQDPTLFYVVLGHEQTDVEDAVEQGEGYTVVRKADGAAEVARELDPRDD
jgi:5-bromo-4-chloroindolyl phosphate hydrolysis protein